MRQQPIYHLGNTPFTLPVLAALYPSTRQISDKARRMEHEGEIIRLKKGLYVRCNDNGTVPQPGLVANHLYGPSYVSMLTALRHYGLIPERVYAIQSLTFKHNRSFDTPIGRYEYFSCPVGYFHIGIRQVLQGDSQYLIATPEKALCDLLVKTRGLSLPDADSMAEYLEHDLRVDLDDIKDFDRAILDLCCQAAATRRDNITALMRLLS